MAEAFLGLDCGTGSLKAALVDLEGRVLVHRDAGYPVESPRPGWAETRAEAWWTAAVQATRAVLAEVEAATSIVAIGVCGQMHGFVPVDGNGAALRPAVTWADDRAMAQVERFRALPVELRARLGNPILPGMAGPICCWLADHEPDVLAATAAILFPKDWLRLRLTGLLATDPCDASGGLLYDVPADTWAFEVLEALDLPVSILPPILASATVAGPLSAEAARQLGLAPGIPVAVGSTDTAASAVGTGAVEAGDVRLTVGTGAQAFVLHDHPVIDPDLRTHCFRSAMDSQWYAMAAVQNAGLALDWLRRAFGADWSELDAIAAEAPAVDGPLFVPFLTHERPHQPRGGMGGRFLDVRLDHTRRDLLRAGLEGVACGVRAALDALVGPDEADPVTLAGGSTRQAGWTALMADTLARRLAIVETPAQSARGASLVAAVAVGAWPSVVATRAVAPPARAIVEPERERSRILERVMARYVRAWSEPSG